MICPHCQTNNLDTARFCVSCGQELVHHCANCQTELPDEARFCMACGQPVLAETAADTSRLDRLTSAVPESLVQKMRASKALQPAHRPGSLGEQRTITTLLLDVVGSTALSTQVGSETWSGIIDRAFELIAPLIYHYEGTIVRTLGDTLLAFFGAPVAHEDDPQRAVRCGLEVIAEIRAYAQELKAQYAIDFVVRACINTGSVVIGPLDEDNKYDYTSESGTVNLTSRIKFASQTMSVLVTANTYRFIAPYFDCEDLGSVEVKGLPGLVQVYRVTKVRIVVGRARGFKDLDSPIVGRDAELATLNRLCEAVHAGLGRAVLIMGEPGLGKTRLVQEWQKSARVLPSTSMAQTPDGTTDWCRWVTGRSTAYGQGVAYQLIIDLLRNLIGVTDGSDEPETRAAFLSLTSELLGEEMMQVYPYLGRLLSIRLEGEAAERANINDPQAMQTQYLLALQRLFLACIRQRPLILVLEDLHWADGTSVELLTKLLPLVSSGPILYCLVTRTERNAPAWKLVTGARELLGGSLTEINLNALTEKESRTLVANLLKLESLPRKLRELILRKAEGNPYFVEEVIRMLIERGTIINRGGAWVADKDISERDIPDNLQGLLLARIDRLPPDARYTLLVASVIGRNFPVRVLSHVIGEA